MGVHTWSENLTDQLKDLYTKGCSCSVIAGELGNGLTRNAVIGKVHRLGLIRRGAGRHAVVEQGPRNTYPRKPSPPRERPPSPRRVLANMVEREKLRCVEIEPRHLSLMDLEPADCRFPYGDGPMTFCGHPKMIGSSYCVPHFYLSIGPGTPSERAATWGMVNA